MINVKKVYLMAIGFLTFGVHDVASADTVAPAMFTNCPDAKSLKSPTNGSGVYFSADCSVGYVLPPRLGEISIAQPTRTANVRVCSAVESVFATIEDQSRRVNRYIKEIEAAEKSLTFGDLDDPWISVGKGNEPNDSLNPELEKLEALREKVSESVLKVLKFNESLSGYEGPKVRLTVTADHNALVHEYQKLNPRLTLRPMPIAKSVLTFVGQIKANVGRAPAALYMDMSGVRVPASYFSGLKPEDGAEAKSPEQMVTLFTSAVAGQLVLSLVGACPFYDIKSGTFPEIIDAKTMTSHISPTVDYVYNVQVNRTYEARYNLSELLKRIQKQSTRGGFFTSKSLHSLVIENSASGWFEFKSLSEDPRQQWDDQLAQTIKAQLIARVLARLGAKPVGASEIPAMIAPGKTGGAVASKGLKLCPHIYCQAGAYIIEGLGAMVGGKTSVSEFISSNDQWEKETVRERKMVPQLGQVGFAAE